MDNFKYLLAIFAFVGAMGFTLKFLYHMYNVVTNITGKSAYLLGPLVLFMPNQFNDFGNKHRTALGVPLFGLITCWLILYFTGEPSKV